MAYIKYYEIENKDLKSIVKADTELFNIPYTLTSHLPNYKIKAFEFGNDIFVKAVTKEEIINSLVESKFYAPLDSYINRTIKMIETGFVDSNTLETIKGHLTTIMSLRKVGNISNKEVLIKTYINLFNEIENATGETFDYKIN